MFRQNRTQTLGHFTVKELGEQQLCILVLQREICGFRFLGNCPPTPPLSHHFALSEKKLLMLAEGRGRWVVS